MEEKDLIVVDETAENVDETAENVDETTEETVKKEEQVKEDKEKKLYTQEDLDELIHKNVARNEAKIHKEYERKYGPLENVLRAGTGKESVEEITQSLKQYYESKGVQFPAQQQYSARDIEVLAKAEADEIISAGLNEVIEEVDRLANIGLENMNAREKALFKNLGNYRTEIEKNKELAKLGVPEGVYNSREFKNFAAQFNSNTPIKDVYDIYARTTQKPNFEKIGSMKNTNPQKDNDIYTPEEVDKLTSKDMDDPKIFEKVRRSMLKW